MQDIGSAGDERTDRLGVPVSDSKLRWSTFVRASRLRYVTGLLAATVVCAVVVEPQATSSPPWVVLAEQGLAINRLTSTLLDLAPAHAAGTLESNIVSSLSDVSAHSELVVLAVGDLLLLADKIAAENRAPAYAFVRRRLDRYASTLENNIKRVNTNLAFSKSPAVVNAGAELRTKLQQAADFITKLQLP